MPTIAFLSLQAFFAIIFIFTGSMKLFTPKEKLPQKGITGFENIQPLFIHLLGLAEGSGAMLLILFTVLNSHILFVKGIVVCYAALMLAASYHHLVRKESGKLKMTLVLLCVCLFILVFK